MLYRPRDRRLGAARRALRIARALPDLPAVSAHHCACGAQAHAHACRKDTTLKQFLDGFKTEPGLALNWVLVGPSGQADRPPGGGVLRAYTSCVKAGDKVVKSIANTYYLANIGSNPHVFEYRRAPRHANSSGQASRPVRAHSYSPL